MVIEKRGVTFLEDESDVAFAKRSGLSPVNAGWLSHEQYQRIEALLSKVGYRYNIMRDWWELPGRV